MAVLPVCGAAAGWRILSGRGTFCRTPPPLGAVYPHCSERADLRACKNTSLQEENPHALFLLLLAAVTSASVSPRLSPPQPPSLPTSSRLRCAVTPLSVGAVGSPPPGCSRTTVIRAKFLSEYLGTKVARSALDGPSDPCPPPLLQLSLNLHSLFN